MIILISPEDFLKLDGKLLAQRMSDYKCCVQVNVIPDGIEYEEINQISQDFHQRIYPDANDVTAINDVLKKEYQIGQLTVELLETEYQLITGEEL